MEVEQGNSGNFKSVHCSIYLNTCNCHKNPPYHKFQLEDEGDRGETSTLRADRQEKPRVRPTPG